ncbi:MAG: dTDP-4-dehydrorhamnose 3,5-epimerase [Granulosicoccus sp.]
MEFIDTPLSGAKLVDLQRIKDSRGFFARAFCSREFAEAGLNEQVVQANFSYNEHKGTLRGLHYQTAPALESKLVRCVRGSIVDVLVDLREESATYLQHFSAELSAENRRALYVPARCAHGFQTLEDHCEVLYLVSGYYTPECECGLRYCDPQLAINWPVEITQVSDKDQQWPLLETTMRP